MEDPSAVTRVSKLQEWEQAALVFFVFPAAKNSLRQPNSTLNPPGQGVKPNSPHLHLVLTQLSSSRLL